MLSDRFKNVVHRLERMADEGALDFSHFKYGMGQLRDLISQLRTWENSSGPGSELITPKTGDNVIDFMAEQHKRDGRNDH